MISKLVKPKNVLEIGTFTGYSALCLSEGLAEGGIVYTIDVNEELENMVRSFFEKAGNRVQDIIRDRSVAIAIKKRRQHA